MPRLTVCHQCLVLQRMPDVHPKTPLVPAILEWETGERYVYQEDNGHPVMVPAFDPVMEDFVIKHDHGRDDNAVLGGMIQVYNIDAATWNAVDMVTQIKKELHDQHNAWYEEKDEYREAALKCYNAHGNPDLQSKCPDYMDDSKRIGPQSYKVEGEHRKVEIPDRFRQYLCYVCFTGDTEVITRWGTKTFSELLDDQSELLAELLVAPTHGQWGGFRLVNVYRHGTSPVVTLHLRRGRSTKTVRCTPEHRWVVDGQFVNTTDLMPGTRLDSLYTTPLSFSGSPVQPSPQGVQHGIVFGDGTTTQGYRPTYLLLYGEKMKLATWFPNNPQRMVDLPDEYTDDQALRIDGLPKRWKLLPDLWESRSYLLGWLAGYFAADGSVSKNGQAVLESAKREHLQLASDVCYLLGIQVSTIQTRKRQGIRGAVSELHRVTIRAADLPEVFWLKEAHRHNINRGQAVRARQQWKVERIEDVGEVEEVFCASVPTERFALAHNLMTGNCPYQQTHIQTELRWRKGLYK